MDDQRQTTRRTFIRQAACSTVGYGAMISTLLDLLKVNAAAQTAPDYRALVCVFLYGGNDANNLLIPRTGADYLAYAIPRGALAIPQASLLPIYPANAAGRDWGLHPSMPELQALFGAGRVAVLSNVGPLAAPITRTQYINGGVEVPPNLFSHDDQQVLWQASVGDDSDTSTGWGGRTADLLRSLNDAGHVSMSMSFAGRNTFQTGRTVFQYQVSPNGSSFTNFKPGSTDPESVALERILRIENTNVFELAYRDTLRRVVESEQRLQAALNSAPPLVTPFPNSGLAQQLSGVARLIAVRSTLGHRRQTYFCSAGGYDTHGNQVASQAALLQELSAAVAAFYDATVELGVADKVTTFTASDFGRTLLSNGTGSDHGWGSHHLIVGGGVIGNRLYGQFPALAIDGPDDTGDGRWIPSTSVDEYSATLARWFGVSASDMPLVFPNLGRFAVPNLGFMA
jgi:uncharacterized protein (DUF1501 family)